MRTQFTFYKSFDDVLGDLTDKQIAQYIKVLCDVQFLRKRIEDVKFDDKILSIVWKSQKHSIQTSLGGYIASQQNRKIKNPYLGVYDTPKVENKTPSEGGRQQEQDKEQDKEEKKINKKKNFLFTLKEKKQYENLSEEYKTKLKAKCLLIDGNFKRYEDFILQLQAKGYQYKDFTKAYMSWDKEKNYKSFTPTKETQLGDEWYRVSVSATEKIAINKKTLEIKHGKVQTANQEEYIPDAEISVKTHELLKAKGLA